MLIQVSKSLVLQSTKSSKLPSQICGCLPLVSRRWLRSSPDSPLLEAKPWPWRHRNFGLMNEWLGEKTLKRFNENTKSIAVMGNIASGKTAFAKKFANEFGMLHVPDVKNSELWVVQPYGFDVRSLRQYLRTEPCQNMIYDLEQFYQDANPTGHSDGVLNLLRLFYEKRYMRFVDVYLHLFSTGQGVVLDSSPYSTLAYAHAYHECGFINSKALSFIETLYTNTLTSFFRPHIIYYVDTPISKCLANVRSRGIPWERNSSVLNERLLTALDAAYKQVVLPKMKRYCEIFVLSEEEMNDWPVIVEEAENLNLEPEVQHITASEKFKDWADLTEEKASRIRRMLSYRYQWYLLLQEQGVPAECPNAFLIGDHYVDFQNVVYKHPAMRYWPGWNRKAGDRGMSFGKLIGKKTYAYYEDLEYDCIGWDPVRSLQEHWRTQKRMPAVQAAH